MPIYTYRCKNCGIQFDQQQKFSDAPLTRCPECSKKSLQKVFQPVGILFKGSGFYSTDNRSSSSAASRLASASKSDSSDTKSDSSSSADDKSTPKTTSGESSSKKED